MTVYVCPDRDIECGSRPASWCSACPLRAKNAGQAPYLRAEQSPAALTAISDEQIDAHLDAVLRAAGSRLSYYTMPKTLANMRAAMRAAMEQESSKSHATM